MAVKQLSDLLPAGSVGDTDLLLLRQGGEDKKYEAGGIFGGKYGLNSVGGASQALYQDAGIVPNTVADTISSSQYLDALKTYVKPASSISVQGPSGSERDGQSKFDDYTSILDFLGIDDDDGSLTTTNNLIPFSQYFQYLNSIGGGRMYLPKTNTGGYLINGDDTTLVTSPIEIVADEGVYLRIIYSGGIGNSPFANNNVKCNRQILKIQQNFGFNNYTQPNTGILPAETLPSITQGQGVILNLKS